MNHDEAIRILSKKREGISTTAPLRQALDYAIAQLEGGKSPANATTSISKGATSQSNYHSGDSTDMVTQFDELVKNVLSSRGVILGRSNDFISINYEDHDKCVNMTRLIKDMHAHIVQLENTLAKPADDGMV